MRFKIESAVLVLAGVALVHSAAPRETAAEVTGPELCGYSENRLGQNHRSWSKGFPGLALLCGPGCVVGVLLGFLVGSAVQLNARYALGPAGLLVVGHSSAPQPEHRPPCSEGRPSLGTLHL